MVESDDTGVPADASELVARLRARLAEQDLAPPRRWWRPTRRRTSEFLAGGVAVVVALAAAAALGRGATSRPIPARNSPRVPSTGAPARTAPSRPPAEPHARTADDVVRVLPARWRRGCRAAPALDPRAPSALVCAPTAGTIVEVRPASRPAIARVMARLVPPGAAAADPACARERDIRTWATASRPSVIRGSIECFRSTRGVEIVWSIDAAGLVLRARRDDGDIGLLFRWWRASTF